MPGERLKSLKHTPGNAKPQWKLPWSWRPQEPPASSHLPCFSLDRPDTRKRQAGGGGGHSPCQEQDSVLQTCPSHRGSPVGSQGGGGGQSQVCPFQTASPNSQAGAHAGAPG